MGPSTGLDADCTRRYPPPRTVTSTVGSAGSSSISLPAETQDHPVESPSRAAFAAPHRLLQVFPAHHPAVGGEEGSEDLVLRLGQDLRLAPVANELPSGQVDPDRAHRDPLPWRRRRLDGRRSSEWLEPVPDAVDRQEVLGALRVCLDFSRRRRMTLSLARLMTASE